MMQLFWTAAKTLQPRSLKSAVFYTILFVAVALYIATQSVSTEPHDNTGSSQRSVRSNLQSLHLKVRGPQSGDRSSNKTRQGEGKGSEGLEHNDVRSVRDGKQNKKTKIDPLVPIGHVDDHLNQNKVQKEKQLQSALNTNHVESEEAHSLRKDTFGQEPNNPGLPEAGTAKEVKEGVLNNGGGLQSEGGGGTQPLAQSKSKTTLNEAKQGAPATAEKATNKVAGHDEGLGFNGNVFRDKPKVQVSNPAGGLVNTDKKESNQKEVVVDKAVALNNMKQVAIAKNPLSGKLHTATATTTTTTTHAADVINPHDFGYLINNETLCRSAAGPIHHIIYFHSNPQTIKVRARLRRSWAQDNLFANFTSRRVFFMGRPSNEKLLANIRAEGHQYGDIVMEDYHDSYNNLTLKAIGAMKWIDRFCPNAHFLVKADEDVYVNIFKVIEDLTGWFANRRRFFLCSVYYLGTMPILRRPQDCAKWCVPDNVFPGEKTYPTYCAGATYVLSADITRDLYAISLRTPYFYIDDAYLTGILVKKLGSIRHYDMGKRSLRISSKNIEHTMFEANATRIVYGIHDKRMNSGYYWKNHLRRLSKEQIALIGEDKYNTLIREFNVTQRDNESMR